MCTGHRHSGNAGRADDRQASHSHHSPSASASCECRRTGTACSLYSGVEQPPLDGIGPGGLNDTAILHGMAGVKEKERWRSEEHTSELQSLMRISYAVFCLKKKNKTTKH